MANNYCLLSFIVDAPNEQAAIWLEHHAGDQRTDTGYPGVETNRFGNDVHIWEDESAQPDALNENLRDYLARYDVNGSIFYEYACICDKARPDNFGGGACLVTSTDFTEICTAELREQMERDNA